MFGKCHEIPSPSQQNGRWRWTRRTSRRPRRRRLSRGGSLRCFAGEAVVWLRNRLYHSQNLDNVTPYSWCWCLNCWKFWTSPFILCSNVFYIYIYPALSITKYVYKSSWNPHDSPRCFARRRRLPRRRSSHLRIPHLGLRCFCLWDFHGKLMGLTTHIKI